jgi:hypothetical protein
MPLTMIGIRTRRLVRDALIREVIGAGLRIAFASDVSARSVGPQGLATRRSQLVDQGNPPLPISVISPIWSDPCYAGATGGRHERHRLVGLPRH